MIEIGIISKDWKVSCIFPIYRWKGDRRECANYRGMSIVIIPEKIYGRIMISRVIESTKEHVVEEKG